jgi:hypothetical protein
MMSHLLSLFSLLNDGSNSLLFYFYELRELEFESRTPRLTTSTENLFVVTDTLNEFSE